MMMPGSSKTVGVGSTSSSSIGARVRMKELFEFWVALPQSQSALNQLMKKMIEQVPQSVPHTPPRKVPSEVESPQEQQASSPIITVIGMDDLPTAQAHQAPSERVVEPPAANSPRKMKMRTTFTVAKSPREVKLTPPKHMVDEVDAAHMRGALSPRALSPGMHLNQDLHTVGHSPLENSIPLVLDPGLLGMSALDSLPPIRSQSPSDAPGSAAHSARSPCRSRSSSVGSIQSLKMAVEKEKPKYATYQDISRFYFAEGKPQTTSCTVDGPLSTKHENPHLVIHEGIAIPLGGGNVVTDRPSGARIAPMVPLTSMEDEDVPLFIQKQLSEAASAGQPGQKKQSLKNPKRPQTSNLGKGEQILRAMQRICTQAFGLPSYFTRLVANKLVHEAQQLSSPSASQRPGTSSGSNPQFTVITPTVVKDFYEKYLRFKSITRRIFDVLVATSAAHHDPKSGDLTTTGKRNYLVREDFVAYIDVLLEHHPGLAFLKQTTDFQAKYRETVIIRIFYELDRLDRGRISWPEFEQSKLPDAIRQVDATEDINSVLNFFSYEHFYVLYCHFWELDTNRDMLLSQQDLMKYFYPETLANTRMLARVMSGAGRKLKSNVKGKMCYEDFVWFCMSEEDKSSPKAIRYWFKVLDEDGDGVLSHCEMETAFNFSRTQLQAVAEQISFNDVICQIHDMFPHAAPDGLRLCDLLAAPQSAFVALNMLLNVARFCQFEQRDPFVAHHDRVSGGLEKTEWDKFARLEYDRMAAEADGEEEI